MKLALDEVLATSLVEPANPSVRSANTAQFALLLSLAYQSQAGTAPASAKGASVESEFAPFHLDRSLGFALQSGSAAAFNLYNCLYRECPVSSDGAVKPAAVEPGRQPVLFDRRGRGAEMISEIEASRRQVQSLDA